MVFCIQGENFEDFKTCAVWSEMIASCNLVSESTTAECSQEAMGFEWLQICSVVIHLVFMYDRDPLLWMYSTLTRDVCPTFSLTLYCTRLNYIIPTTHICTLNIRNTPTWSYLYHQYILCRVVFVYFILYQLRVPVMAEAVLSVFYSITTGKTEVKAKGRTPEYIKN